MPTKKTSSKVPKVGAAPKKAAVKKTTKVAKETATKAPVKKVAAKKTSAVEKAIVKKVATKKAVARKPVTTKAPVKKVVKKVAKSKVPSLEQRLEAKAFELVDQASSLLKEGIKTSHKATAGARRTVHRRAHKMITKASGHLDDLIETSLSAVRNTIDKL
jgi:hypothetical protein